MSKKFLIIVIIFQALILVSAVIIGNSMGKIYFPPTFTRDSEFDQLNSVMEYIKEYYKDKDSVTRDKLIYGAVKGMVESLGDPYSQYLTPETYKEMMDDTSGKFGGLGIEISLTNLDGHDKLTIISAFEGNPAYKSGIRAGDYIMEIDGQSTNGISLYDAKRKLRGEPGTKVKLKIDREHEDEPIEYVITRDIIQISTVNYKILDGNIAYIRISQFSDTTSNDFYNTLEKIEKENVKGIIMDLRSNPGGTLSSAIDVASSFLGKDQLVVSTQGRIRDSNKEYKTSKNAYHTDLPLIVLVDRWSASGSEIVVGAIKDHKRGIIMGTSDSTYGKGSVQTIFSMPKSDGGLKLTIANYYTPSGKNINKVGIAPDIKIPTLTPEQRKIYQLLDSNKNIENFIKESGDDVLTRIAKSNNEMDKSKFDNLVNKLKTENINLDESYIKYAIAEKTKNNIDDYEYDPVIKYAIAQFKKAK